MIDIKKAESLIESGEMTEELLKVFYEIKEKLSETKKLKKFEDDIKKIILKNRNQDGPHKIGDFVVTVNRFETKRLSKDKLINKYGEQDIEDCMSVSQSSRISVEPKEI